MTVWTRFWTVSVCVFLWLSSTQAMAAPSLEFRVLHTGELSGVVYHDTKQSIGIQIYVNRNAQIEWIRLESKELALLLYTNGTFRFNRLKTGTSFAVKFDRLGRLTRAGTTRIQYDIMGRLQSLGGLAVSYLGQGLLNNLGGLSLTYRNNLIITDIGGTKLLTNTQSHLSKVSGIVLEYGLGTRLKKVGNRTLSFQTQSPILKAVGGTDSRFKLSIFWNLPGKCQPFLCSPRP